MIPTDAEMIFWSVALVVAVLFIAGLLIIGNKVWGD